MVGFSPVFGFYSPLVRIGRKRAWPGEITASGSIVVNCDSGQTAMWPYNPLLSLFWGAVSALLQNPNSSHKCQLKLANKDEMKVISSASDYEEFIVC